MEHFKVPNNVRIDETAFIAPNATVVGNVTVAAHASVWFNAVIRAELDHVTLGERSNVQDGAVIHVDEGHPVVIGRNVTVGHRAVVHGAPGGDHSLVGHGGHLVHGAVIGENSIVGAGALVPEGKTYPPNSLLIGVPARVARTLTDEQVARIAEGADHYVMFGSAYHRQLGDVI
ncbi:MAG: gamma carbonic anhydrase family protein [Candidatus Sericytochromatia bacterium]